MISLNKNISLSSPKTKKYISTLIYSLISLVFSSYVLYGQESNTNTTTNPTNNIESMKYDEMSITHILGSSTRLCTGVSIAQRAIITTADCVLGNDVPILIKPDVGFRNFQKILPDKVYIHPLYDANKNKFQYNLAVLVYPEFRANVTIDDTTPPALIPVAFYFTSLFKEPLFLDPYFLTNPNHILKTHNKHLNIKTYSTNQKHYNDPDSYFNYSKIILNTDISDIIPVEHDSNETSFMKSKSTANSSVFVRHVSCGLQSNNTLTNCTDTPMNPKINLGSGLFYDNELIAIYSGSRYTVKNSYANPYFPIKIVNIDEYWTSIANSDTYKFLKETVPTISTVNIVDK